MRFKLLCALVGVWGLFLAGPALGETIFGYGDCDGAGGTVTYKTVTETVPEDGAAQGRFMAPQCFGNLMDFNPMFAASATDGGSDSAASQLNFTIMADLGSFIDEIRFAESGEFDLVGDGGAATNVMADLSVTITVTKTNQGTVIPFGFDLLEENDNPSATFLLPGDAGLNNPWDLLAMFDVGQLLVDACNSGDFDNVCGALATEVQVVLDNALSANSADEGDDANIFKKDAKGITITVVPEPQTLLLLAAGLIGLALQTRRPS